MREDTTIEKQMAGMVVIGQLQQQQQQQHGMRSIPRNQNVGDEDIDAGDDDGNDHDREASLEERVETNGIALLFGQTTSDHIGRCTDQCSVATKAGSVRQRPNQWRNGQACSTTTVAVQWLDDCYRIESNRTESNRTVTHTAPRVARQQEPWPWCMGYYR
jgi:hypothetical protein